MSDSFHEWCIESEVIQKLYVIGCPSGSQGVNNYCLLIPFLYGKICQVGSADITLQIMNDTRKFGAFTSSQNPEELATRVKGIVLAMSSILIFIAGQFFHITVSANDILTLATELGSIAGAVMTLYGAGLWVVSYFAKKPTV